MTPDPADPEQASSGGRWVQALWSVLRLTGLLLLVALGYRVVGPPPPDTIWSVWGIVEEIARFAALLLPFAAVVTAFSTVDLRTSHKSALRAVLGAAAIVGVLSYVLLAVVAPIAEQESDIRTGFDVGIFRPLGAETPSGLFRQRAYLVAHPPESLSFSTTRPLDRPVSWVDYKLHSPVAHGALSLINALIGLWVGVLTMGSSGTRRRLSRWAVGLFGALGYLAVSAAAGAWLRSHPTSSGALWAWISLVLPLLELALFYALARRRGVGLRASDSAGA